MTSRIQDIFVAGGTSGIGNAIALHYLRQGSRVTIAGQSVARGERFLSMAEQMGAADRAAFIAADLKLVDENRRVIQEVKSRHHSLDAVILSAIRLFSKRIETQDGLEGTFSLYYMSRFLLSYGLTPLLEQSNNSVIVSLGGTGVTQGRIHWNDLSLHRDYNILRATLQGGRANDLLGVGYAANHTLNKTHFILSNPGFTNTGYHNVSQPWLSILRLIGHFFATPVDQSIRPLIALIENPPLQPLIAWERNKPLPLTLKTLDPSDARRLYQMTNYLLEALSL